MFYIATYDVGTTAVKGVLVAENGDVAAEESVLLHTLFEGDHKEQDPEEWFAAFCTIGKSFAEKVAPGDIRAVIMSGQMQDLILVDSDGKLLRNAILYSDVRAQEEAQELIDTLGEEFLCQTTGNHFDGSLPLPKLSWVRKHEPELFGKIHKLFISSKDYIIYRLTGAVCGDMTACSTAGAMDIRRHVWNREIIQAAGAKTEMFPELYFPHEMVGRIAENAANECGYLPGTAVYAGVGDAGATTLASGISGPGEYNINIGTSGWVAGVSKNAMELGGRVFNLAGVKENTFINVVPFFNAGNVHKWVAMLFSEREDQIEYDKIGKLLQESEPASHGLLFLPYLTGERFPVIDPEIKGCYYGITPTTTKEDMIRACLEGVAFSIRQGLEMMSEAYSYISIIGGGAREPVWCQMLADILGMEVYAYRNSDTLPAKALASCVLYDLGIISDYSGMTDLQDESEQGIRYHCQKETEPAYEEAFARFKKLYPSLRGVY